MNTNNNTIFGIFVFQLIRHKNCKKKPVTKVADVAVCDVAIILLLYLLQQIDIQKYLLFSQFSEFHSNALGVIILRWIQTLFI